MFLIWGSKQKSIVLAVIRTRHCDRCEMPRAFRARVDYQYNHLWYVFGFASGKQFTESCEACGEVAAIDEAVIRAEIGKNPIPYWDRFGLLSAFGGLVGFIFFLVLLRASGPEIRNIPDLVERMKRGDETALAQLRREAQQGDLPSQEALANLLAWDADPRFLNLEEAFHWTLAAAKQGSLAGELAVAQRLDYGQGTTADPAEAMRWYLIAAKHGSARAQNSVGVYYALGRTVAPDEKEAIRWLTRAAEAGDITAAFNLGVMYVKTSAGDQGFDEATMIQAIHWLEIAANASTADADSLQAASGAHNELGKLYEQGDGVERDVLKALNHFQAAGPNNTEAVASVDRLKLRLSQ